MAAQAIGSLYAQLGLDTASFDTGIAKARGKLTEFGKINFGGAIKAGLGEIDGALKSTASRAGALGNVLGGLGIAGTAAAAAIAVAFAGARQAMAFGDEIADTANKLRVTTDYLQELRFAAHQLGGEFQDADAALEGFTKTFGMAKSGLSAKAIKPFAALGLDPKSFETVQQALDAVIDKIAGLGDAAEQAAVADKLGLTPLLPAIREGASAIDEVRKAAHELGYVMDADLIAKAGDANDKFEALQAVLDVQFKSAMVDAIPLVMQLTEFMVGAAKAAGEFARNIQSISDKLAYIGTHDLGGNMVGNDRDRLFARIAQRNGLRQIAANADPIGQGGVSITNMRAMFGAPEAAKPSGRLVNLEDKRKAETEAERKAAEAERERKAALKALTDAMHEAEQASASYAASLLDDIATMGMSSRQLKEHEMAMAIAAAPTQALANTLTLLRDQYVAQIKVGEDWAKVQKVVNDQQSETIDTVRDSIGSSIAFTSRLEGLAASMGGLADLSQDVSWGIQDMADAINGNDWVGAFASLTRVLAQVQTAFNSAASAKDKFMAVAAVANGVGQAVGGTGGAAISGAASGAMAGFTVGGPVGAVVGGLIGGLGGIFGSSKAKKQARRQAEAQRAAEEAQRQQTIADTTFALDVALLRAQGQEQAAVTKEREKEIARLQALSPALAETQKQLYALEDAAKVSERRSAIQAEIDKLTLSSSEQLARTREKERAEAVALDPTLGDLIDKLYGIQDATTAAADASKMATESANRLAEAQMEQAAQVQQALGGIASASERVADALKETMRSLTDFADSLKAELGLSTTGGALDQARKAFNAAVSSGNYAAIPQLGQAYAEAAKSGAGSEAEYRRILAQIRIASLNSVGSAKVQEFQQQLSLGLLGAWLSGNDSLAEQIMRQRAAGLPGFANGGSFMIGGNPGVDQNLLSVNGVPAARVGQGEIVSVKKGPANDNSYAEMVVELRALRAEVAAQRKAVERLDRNIDAVTEGGNAMLTEAAS